MAQFSPLVHAPIKAAALPSRLPQRACACASKASSECGACKAQHPQRREIAGGFPSGLPSLTSFETGGRPLARHLRERLEPSFGVSFADVRVHDDSASHAAARRVQANAFTFGQHIHFASGQFHPDESDGLRLLAHELAHTVQQRGHSNSVARDAIARDAIAMDDPDSEMEHRADVAAGAAMMGRNVGTLSSTGLVLARQAHPGASTGRAPGSTGVRVPGAPRHPRPTRATAAVFSESTTARFNGYDASVRPNWLVIPAGGSRTADVAVTPAGGAVSFISDNTSVATVTPTGAGVTVNGVAAGTTQIEARAGSRALDLLAINVKNPRDVWTGFNYVRDSAPPTPHSTTGTTADTPRLLAGLNLVWEQQANVRFTDGGSRNVTVSGDLGANVEYSSSGGGEWYTVVALGSGRAYNVFRVWEVLNDGRHVNGGVTVGANTMLEDISCPDGLTLAHEAGHYLTLDHPDGGVMSVCFTRTDRRVTKAAADRANP
jgi:Domain of unknown function (DUF4157)/Bacterial Ig-like domain (group 2)